MSRTHLRPASAATGLPATCGGTPAASAQRDHAVDSRSTSAPTATWAGCLGIAVAVTGLVLGMSLGSTPGANAAVDEYRTFLVRNRGALLAFGPVSLLTAVAVAWITTELVDRARRRRDDALPVSAGLVVVVAVLGGLLLVTANLMGTIAAVRRPFVDEVGDDVLRMGWLTNQITLNAAVGMLGALMIVAGATLHRSGALPRRLAIAGGAGGVLTVTVAALGITTASWVANGSAGVVLVNLWLIAASVVLIRGDSTVRVAAERAADATVA